MSFVLGGQFGSCGKGAAAAFLSERLFDEHKQFDIITTNAGSQSGHTSVFKDGIKRVQFHLPTASLNPAYKRQPLTYLNAGAVIDPGVLQKELEENPRVASNLYIHPNAAVITQDCKDAEGRADSAQTKIASTRKGVGEALARKVLRSGLVARDHPYLKQFVRRIDLNERLMAGHAVLAEVPQGFSLGIDQPFYPHTTSRNCTVMQAMSDAGVHPQFYGQSMLVVRTYPIRVGNIPAPEGDGMGTIGDEYGHFDLIGHSGGAYPGQLETSWEALGQPAEITTVTKRVRRVFEFSQRQLIEAMQAARPSSVFLSFCDYLKSAEEFEIFKRRICDAAVAANLNVPYIYTAFGPSTADVTEGIWPRS